MTRSQIKNKIKKILEAKLNENWFMDYWNRGLPSKKEGPPLKYRTPGLRHTITADGTRIRIQKASDYKFVALSRNLLKRWCVPFDYGDFILMKGTKDKDGLYQVRDTMNKKWVNVLDILESTHVTPYKYENVHIYKMKWTERLDLITYDS